MITLIGGERALGLSLTPRGWQAVHLESRLGRPRILGRASGPLPEVSGPEDRILAERTSGEATESSIAEGATGTAAGMAGTEGSRAAAALSAACEELGIGPGTRLAVALARPMAHVKRLALPRAGRRDLGEAIRRQAAEIFPVGRQAVIADFRRLPGNGRAAGEERPGLAAAAAEELLEAIAARAEALGLELAAADLAAGAAHASLPDSVEAVLVLHEDGVEWAEFGDGGVAVSRFFPGARRAEVGDTDAGVTDGNRQPAPGSRLERLPAEIRDRISQRRVAVVGPAAEEAAALDPAEEAVEEAAEARAEAVADSAFAIAHGSALQALGARPSFDLRPERLRRSEAAAARRRTLVLAASALAAGLIFWLGGVLATWLEVGALEREVAALEPQVQEVLAGQSQYLRAAERLAAMEGLQATQPRWSRILSELALSIPGDAFITGVGERDDGLRLEGYAASASAAIAALERSPLVAGVRLTGPVSRESTPAGERERFTVEVRLGGEGP